jgi:hypothetical protein
MAHSYLPYCCELLEIICSALSDTLTQGWMC